MSDYKKIVELRPEMADFFGNRRLIAFRGDVLSYMANVRSDSFSTDASGFRHSTLGGREYSVADCIQSERYGIVLGASNMFGFGIAGNENTVASLLSERFGFPFANAAMPGGNSRNLQALLVGLVAAAGTPPAVVVHSSGGELANFCESGLADPIFGSPNRPLLKTLKEAGPNPEPEENLPRLLAFTGLWCSALATLCKAYKAGLVLVHQSTFFEKAKPTELELECGLGEPFHQSQAVQFANHRKFDRRFYERRKAIADTLGLPLAGWDMAGELTFMDEFHVDAEGMKAMSQAIGDEVETLLSTESSARKAVKKARDPASA
jgi:hypothetical protein